MNFIVAVSENYGIGKDGKMLFDLKEDLKYFREKTLNKIVVMGRKTFLSIPNAPLKNRTNIVLTTDKTFNSQGVIVVHSYEELFSQIEKYNPDDVFIIGGATLYNKLIDKCYKGYITKIHKTVEADTFIDNVENKPNWKEISSSKTCFENDLSFEFKEFENQNLTK